MLNTFFATSHISMWRVYVWVTLFLLDLIKYRILYWKHIVPYLLFIYVLDNILHYSISHGICQNIPNTFGVILGTSNNSCRLRHHYSSHFQVYFHTVYWTFWRWKNHWYTSHKYVSRLNQRSEISVNEIPRNTLTGKLIAFSISELNNLFFTMNRRR